jgi:PAS domain-containing protein
VAESASSGAELPAVRFEAHVAEDTEVFHVRWDPDGVILAASESYAAARQTAPEAIVGFRWPALGADPTQAEQQLALTRRRADAGEVSLSQSRVGPQFAEMHVLWVSVPTRDAAGVLRHVDSYGFDATALLAAARVAEATPVLAATVRAHERERITAQLRGSVLQLLVSALWHLGEDASVAEAAALVHVAVRQLRAVLLDLADPPGGGASGAVQVRDKTVDVGIDVGVDELLAPSWQLVSLFDERGQQRWASPQLRELFGDVDLGVDPYAVAERMPAEDLDRMARMLFATLTGLSPAPLRWQYRHPDGTTHQFVTRMHPVRVNGAIWAVSASAPHPSDEIAHARADERGKLAAWLHDDVVQILTAMRWSADDEMAASIDEVLAKLRTEAARLRDPLEEATLVGAVRALLTSVRTPVTFDTGSESFDGIPKPVANVAYRVVAEGLRNVDRHARASTAEVVVQTRDGELLVAVRDDGEGAAATVRAQLRDSDHLGLRSLRDDVIAVGGELLVVQLPQGIELRAVLPA